jgi:hypothetical protein
MLIKSNVNQKLFVTILKIWEIIYYRIVYYIDKNNYINIKYPTNSYVSIEICTSRKREKERAKSF